MKKRTLLSISVGILSMFFIMVLSGCEFNINDILTIGQVKEVEPEKASANIDANSKNNNNSNTNNNSFTVKFMNGSSEITNLKQTVQKNGTVTKPLKSSIPSKSNQRFDYWALNGEAYNFDTYVTSNLTLDAVYEYSNDYDSYAYSNNNIFYTDFYDEYIQNVNYLSFDMNSPTFQKTNTSNNISNHGKFRLNNGKLGINLGNKRITSQGVVNIYFELQTNSSVGYEFIFSVIGSNKYTSNSEVFCLKASDNARLEYESENGKDFSNYSLVYNTGIRVKLDLSNNYISVYYNGYELFSGISSSVNGITGIYFGMSEDNYDMYIDNIAMTYEPKTINSLTNAKNNAMALIENYYSSYEYYNLNYQLRNYVDKFLYSFIYDIEYANNEQEVSNLLNRFYYFESAEKYSLAVYPYLEPYNMASNVSEAYVNYISGFTSSIDIEDQFGYLYFDGYIVDGVYTDAGLTKVAKYNSVVNKNSLYAKLSITIDSSWYAEYESLGQTSVTSGTQLNSICYVYGTVTPKYNSAQTNCIGFELYKGGAGYLFVQVPKGKVVELDLIIGSTGVSNMSDNVYLMDSYSSIIVPTYFGPYDYNSSNNDGIMNIYSSQNSNVSYKLGEGNYTFACYGTTRGIRLKYVSVREK